jgi:hypothetical protein
MGNYLTSPNSEKHSTNGEIGSFKYGTCEMQGWYDVFNNHNNNNMFVLPTSQSCLYSRPVIFMALNVVGLWDVMLGCNYHRDGQYIKYDNIYF